VDNVRDKGEESNYEHQTGKPRSTDFLAYIPKEVLAENFGAPESAFANLPKEELYIFQSTVPGPLAADRVTGAAPREFWRKASVATQMGMRRSWPKGSKDGPLSLRAFHHHRVVDVE